MRLTRVGHKSTLLRVVRLKPFQRHIRCQSGPRGAVRPIPIKVITVTKGGNPSSKALAEEWAAKIRRYTQLSEVQVKPNPKKAADPDVAVATEGQQVLKAIAPQEHVVVLDERGRDITSPGLADLIAKVGDRGAPALTFCIGGPYGHSADVRTRANDTLRLSSLVLNHQVAHIVLMEQLYRAWTILRGEPYHH